MTYTAKNSVRRSNWRDVTAAWMVAALAIGSMYVMGGEKSAELQLWAVEQGSMFGQFGLPGLFG